MAGFKPISTKWDRENRNEHNRMFEELYKGIGGVVGTITEETIKKIIDSAKLNWLDFVDVYEDIDSTYPNPIAGDAVMSRNDSADYPINADDKRQGGTVWRFNGSKWEPIQSFDASAINNVADTLTEQVDKTQATVVNANFEPEIIAHRGFGRLYPENTIYSGVKSAETGAAIEFDVRLTKDRVPILMHDASVDRTTNGTGNVSDLLYSEIRGLDAGSSFSSRFAGLKIPTLEDYLSAIQGTKRVYVDLKGIETPDELKNIVTMLMKYGFDHNCILQLDPMDNFAENIKTIRQVSSRMIIGASCGNQEKVDAAFPLLIKDGKGAFSANKGTATEANLMRARRNNIDYAISIIYSQQEVSRYARIGFTKLMTDDITEVQY
ncbi:glycerophosphodiester phosphodiesterase [Oceanobacillus neutriphilus]|uniref:GP-PDE domain-containing protein n=1 Tax=Oceanobacillus neutriphilus TaxID=531815 RepID=A0ABQ2P238_9BACI|nr:glycerophosphodiester phosphodiesterase family protein [Oceanobacillus neutriphilus]GGP16219.1 hypothetical protein GCM10011346_47320 [Oceanobacillus neutriphilus]